MGRENILLVKVSGLRPRYSYSGRQSRPLFKPLDDFKSVVLGGCKNIFSQFEYTFYAFGA